MITHILIAKLADGAPDADVDALAEGLRGAAASVDGVLAYRIERDARLREGTDDLVLIARFENEDAFRAYLTHPRHLAVLRERAPGVIASTRQLQFLTDSEPNAS